MQVPQIKEPSMQQGSKVLDLSPLSYVSQNKQNVYKGKFRDLI